MIKKNFTGVLSSLMREQPAKPKRGRPNNSAREFTKSSPVGTKENETGATLIIRENILEKLKGLVYWQRRLIIDLVSRALFESIVMCEKRTDL
jgi:hypothetical protein